MLCSSYRATALGGACVTALDQERAARSIEDHYGSASSNTVLERRLRVTTPDLKNNSKEIPITFEDLHLQDRAMGPIPRGYMGFTWSDSAWFMNTAYSSSVCPGVRIGLLNAHGRDITIENNHLFDLKGLSLCTLWAYNAQVLLEGWEKEVRKYATIQAAPRGSTTRCALDYRGVDHVELKAGGTYLVITAITFLFK